MVFFAANEAFQKEYESRLGKERIILSVPSGVHSHKPPLTNIFTKLEITKEDSECLELFGRYLLPHWTTFGNQCLKLQNVKYFEHC